MRLYSLYLRSKALIDRHSEEECTFIFHRRINDLPHLKNKKNTAGLHKRIGVFFYNVLTRLTVKKQNIGKSDFLCYSGTKNQYDSLYSSFVALNKKKSVVSVLDGRWLNKSSEQEFNIEFNLRVLLVTMFFFIMRSFRLYRRLKHEGLLDSIRLYFDRFCSVYYYIPYFIDVLNEVEPKYVLMSNDHSPANRALLFVAKSMGIKTVYMQHASVSRFFPKLEFDYSFLDGSSAYNIYKEIAQSETKGHDFKEKNIFLSGQKKPTVYKEVKNARFSDGCGVGFSHLDSDEYIVEVIESLLSLFNCCSVRLHPSHSIISIDKLNVIFKDNKAVTINTGKKESLTDFLTNVKVFFGTETSLHLEVALAGIRCFSIGNNDYYGYRKSGLVIPIDLSDITVEKFSDLGFNQSTKEKNAVKQYSATYNTPWFGREGDLVASILNDIEESKINNSPMIFDYMSKDTDSNVWKL